VGPLEVSRGWERLSAYPPVNQLEAARGSVVGPLEVSRGWERLLAYPPVNQLEAVR
jgi:hypothetical protein